MTQLVLRLEDLMVVSLELRDEVVEGNGVKLESKLKSRMLRLNASRLFQLSTSFRLAT